MTDSRQPRWIALAGSTAFVLWGFGAFAADIPVGTPKQKDDLPSSHSDIDHSKIERAKPGKEWWRDVVARLPNCATLTDGCQSCMPNGDTLTCSNPGIACTRTEWRCSAERQPQAEPKPDPATKDAPPTPKQ
jgi:hypothetical protein